MLSKLKKTIWIWEGEKITLQNVDVCKNSTSSNVALKSCNLKIALRFYQLELQLDIEMSIINWILIIARPMKG